MKSDEGKEETPLHDRSRLVSAGVRSYCRSQIIFTAHMNFSVEMEDRDADSDFQ